MAARKKRPSANVDALLEEMLVDAYGDDEQLAALAEGIGDALDFPLDVHVVGEPLSLLAVDYEGNSRRGVVARCRREDGTEYCVSLADIELPQAAAGHLHVAAYCRWLGVEPAAPKRGASAKSTARKHKANDDDIDLSKPVDLIVLAVKERAARCQHLEDALQEPPTLLRTQCAVVAHDHGGQIEGAIRLPAKVVAQDVVDLEAVLCCA